MTDLKQPRLFDGDPESDQAPEADTNRSKYPDPYTLYGRHVTGIPDWSWYSLRMLDGPEDNPQTLIKGGVAPMNKRHPGRRNWRKIDKSTAREFVVTRNDLNAFMEAWGVEIDVCPRCQGPGNLPHHISAQGTRYRACGRCHGTGKYTPLP